MKTSSAYIWGLLGKFGPQIIFLCTTFILARFLSPSDFGQIGILTIFTSIAQTLLEAGLGGSLIKEKHISRLDCSTIFVFNIIISTALYVIIFLCAPYIEDYYNIIGLASVCRCLCLVFVINAWGQIAQTLLFRNLKFKTLMIASISSVIAGSIIALIGAVQLKWGVYSLVAYQLVQSSTYVCFNWFYCDFKLSFKFSKSSFIKLFSFGFFTTVNGIVESIYENLITNLFGRYLGINQAGYLSQAKRIETASVSSLSGTVNSVSFPILTRLKEDEFNFKIEANKLLKYLSLIILPILLTIALFADYIIVFLYGAKWIESAYYLRILMWTGCFFVVESANRNFIKSLGLVKGLLMVTVFKRLFAVVIMIILIVINPKILIYGYFIGGIIGYLANACYYSHIIHYSKFKYLIESIKYLIPPIIFYGISLILKSAPLSDSFPVLLCFWIAVSAVYYFFILPKMGIKIWEFIGYKSK